MRVNSKPLNKRDSYKFKRKCLQVFPVPVVEDIMFAYDLSKYGHHKQLRDDGRRYFDHPRAVSLILLQELRVYDCDLIISSLLHDIPEDSFLLDIKRIHKVYGEKVSHTVWLLTKEFKHKGKNVGKYYKRLIESNNWKACLIKCVDRLHNMRSLETSTLEKRLKQAEETLKYFPIILEKLLAIAPRVYREAIEILSNKLVNIASHYKNTSNIPS